MKDKRRILWSLISLLTIFSLAIPVWATAVEASTVEFAGGSGTAVDPYQIADWHHLDNVREYLGDHFILMNDLSSSTAGYDDLAGPEANEGKGWQPLVTLLNLFTGSFDGQGYKIGDLFIYRPDEDGVGLFGAVDEGGAIRNIAVVNVDVTGSYAVGGLLGDNWGGWVSNCYSAGTVSGNSAVGGLVGWNDGSVTDSYFDGSVSGDEWSGGLVGGNGGIVGSSYSVGSVTGAVGIGGLVGDNFYGTVTQSYSAASVTGNQQVGGLVADNLGGTVTNSYSTATVTGVSHVGGLLGANAATEPAAGGLALSDEDTVGGSYYTRSVIRVRRVATQAETNQAEGTVDNCYATGTVTGDSDVGGLVGVNHDGWISNSFWDMDTSGMEGSDGGTGKTTAEMKDIATFTDTATEGLDEPWDIIAVAFGVTSPAYTWNIVDGQTYPFLSWEEMSIMAVHLSLKAGWNLVSVPVIPADPSVAAVFAGTEVVYAWNATTGSYYMPVEVEPDRGYWVAVISDTVITVSGVPVHSWTAEMTAGWNLIGSVFRTVDFSAPDTEPAGKVESFTFRWHPDTGYSYETTIEPGMGHWVAATQNCVLTLSAQED